MGVSNQNENVQTKNSRIEENGEQIMKKYFKNYMFKEIFGKGNNKSYLGWAF